MHENVRLFDGAIQAANARTVLYLTWTRMHSTEMHSTEMQSLITDAYDAIGTELGATVLPVGRAWEQFLRAHKEPALHDRDQSHPTLAGSYVAPGCYFAVLFGESPVGID